MKKQTLTIAVVALTILAAQACIVSTLMNCGGGNLTSPPLHQTDGTDYYLTCCAPPGQLITTAYNCAGLSRSEGVTLNCNTACTVTRVDGANYGVQVLVNSSVPTWTHYATGDACDECGG